MSDSDLTPPPGTSAASRTVTDQPARANEIAAASPFGPDPTTTALPDEPTPSRWSLAAPASDMLWPRWIFLRAMGLIFGSAFYSLLFQIHGLIGQRGVLPAASYLRAVTAAVPGARQYWLAPTVLWASSGDRALSIVVWVGLAASLLLTVNRLPRLASIVCTIAFLSLIAVLQDFASYQSDGMLLQAGVACACLAPSGLAPGLAASSPPSRASIWLLRWEWFAIYFESGVVKLLSGDVQWRTLTAMDRYYEDSPLPAWPGWYAQQLPHAFHAATVLLTFALELVAPWVVFLRRQPRIVLAIVVSIFQIGIIVTSNYGFLNVLVLVLGVSLVDDRAVIAGPRWLTQRLPGVARSPAQNWIARVQNRGRSARGPSRSNAWISVAVLVITVYVGIVDFLPVGLPSGFRAPARLLAPFRLANAYGLYAVMTTAEYEIEFQGRGNDTTWVAYPFRYKPQDPAVAPRLYVPYQPRFDWNLWFASLGPWNDNPWVVMTQVQLLTNDRTVLSLFAGNPFAAAPPTAVRSVLWRYSFTDAATRRRTGLWWRRELLGLYGGTVSRTADGQVRFEPPGATTSGAGDTAPR